jgi:ABC-type lipoprotein release transport system permease subunit
MNRLTLKALMANSSRSLHIVVAVALSVGLIFSAFTVAEGLVGRMAQMTEGYSLTNIFYVVDPSSSLSSARIGPWVLGLIPPGVQVSPILKAQVKLAGQGSEVDVWGVDWGLFVGVRDPWVKGGLPRGSDEVLVGMRLAEMYGISEGNVIEYMYDGGERAFTVTGVFRTGNQYDDGILASMDTVRDIAGSGEDFSLVELKVKDLSSLASSLSLIKESGLMIVPSKAVTDYIGELGDEVRLDLTLVSAVVAFLVLVFISHTLYKVLSDSLGEIIILRMVGVTRKSLTFAILVNSLILSLAGAILGLLLGLIISSALAVSVFLFMGEAYIVLGFDAAVAELCIVSTAAVGIIGGIMSILLRRPYEEPYGARELL